MSDTIFALASGEGLCAISVIRVSGPHADPALRSLCAGQPVPKPRLVALRTIANPTSGAILDRCLVIRFLAPASFTGEDGFELHIHGGRAVIVGVLEALRQCADLRLAEPGEFTRRAFLNGKLDLTEAEGLADLIEANTVAQRDQALALAGGLLRTRADAWRRDILSLQAEVEADIDFSDEGDVPSDVAAALVTRIEPLCTDMEAVLADGRRGEILRRGFTVVLAGAPNAGKSSLMNALVRRDVAIVSSVPGTTRDPIEISLDLDGLPVTLVDTAGLREAGDDIEKEGIKRARARADAADLVLWLSGPDEVYDGLGLLNGSVLPILSKCDLLPADSAPEQKHRISAHTGEGIEALLGMITDYARAALRPEEPAIMSRQRHRQGISNALEALHRIKQGLPIEVGAEDLRIAARSLGAIIGLVSPEDVLGEIFGRFCIGK